MVIIRSFIVVFIVISAVIAIKQASNKSIYIAQMMGISWGALAGAFLAPFLYGLYWKKTTKAAVVVSFVFGVGLEVIQFFFSIGVLAPSENPVIALIFKNSLYSGVLAMIGGMILVPVVSLLTGKFAPKKVEEMFECYKNTRTVEITDSLGK